MIRTGKVFVRGNWAGRIVQLNDGDYRFAYQPEYLAQIDAKPVSLTLPLRSEPYVSPILFPFFSGLLAEGGLKEMQCRLLRLDENDDFGRLLKTAGHDVIGAVTVEEEVA